VDIGFPAVEGDSLLGSKVLSIADGVVWSPRETSAARPASAYGRVIVAHKSSKGSFYAPTSTWARSSQGGRQVARAGAGRHRQARDFRTCTSPSPHGEAGRRRGPGARSRRRQAPKARRLERHRVWSRSWGGSGPSHAHPTRGSSTTDRGGALPARRGVQQHAARGCHEISASTRAASRPSRRGEPEAQGGRLLQSKALGQDTALQALAGDSRIRALRGAKKPDVSAVKAVQRAFKLLDYDIGGAGPRTTAWTVTTGARWSARSRSSSRRA